MPNPNAPSMANGVISSTLSPTVGSPTIISSVIANTAPDQALNDVNSMQVLPSGTVAADGSAIVSFNTLAASSLTIGSGISGLTAKNTLHLRAGLANVRSGLAPLKIAFVGDSTTLGFGGGGSLDTGGKAASYPTRFSQILTGRGIPSQTDSWFGQGAVSGNYSLYNPLVTVLSGFTADVGIQTVGAAGFKSTATGSVLSFAPVAAFDTMDIFTLNNAGLGSFTVNVDGGATLATVNTSAGGTYVKNTVSCSLGIHTINCTTTSNSYTNIAGIAVRASGTPRVECYNMGWDSSAAGQWASPSTWSPIQGLATIAPNVTFINLTINDINSTSALNANYTNYLQTIITQSLSTGDAILMIGNPCNNSKWTTGSPSLANQYGNVVYALAQSNNIQLVDITQRFSSFASWNSVAPYYDTLHPGALGYADIAAALSLIF